MCFNKFLLMIGENIGKYIPQKENLPEFLFPREKSLIIYQRISYKSIFPKSLNILEKHNLLPA